MDLNFETKTFLSTLLNHLSMEIQEVIKRIQNGEDSRTQFKQSLREGMQLAVELVAFSNSVGGELFIGVSDNGEITGLSAEDIRRYNQFISNASSELVDPPVYPISEVIEIDEKKILLISVSVGTSKPYQTKAGFYWVKVGSDKRKASQQELLRIFQNSGLLHWDESKTRAHWEENLDNKAFEDFFRKHYPEIELTGIGTKQLLENLNLLQAENLNLTGLLLFGKDPESFLPTSFINCVAFRYNSIADSEFLDRKECKGTLREQFDSARSFLVRNLRNLQIPDLGFNQPGKLEVSEKALQEALVNALLHRDYAIPASIRVIIFQDRVEIINPGRLANHLRIANVKMGVSFARNQILTSLGTKILPYTGLGSGIRRMLAEHPATELISDEELGDQFTVIFRRPENS